MSPTVAIVHLALADLSAAGEALAFGLLDAEERARADRYRQAGDRALHIAAHGLARLILGRALAMDPAALRFSSGAHGKPRLTAPEADLRFNLSHTDGLVAVAWAFGLDVGVDVEATTRRVDLKVADRYFSPAEIGWLDRLPAPERAEGFLRLWTAKEAFVKATGKGLTHALQSFSVSFDPPRLVSRADLAPWPQDWALTLARPGPDHLLAAAAPVIGGIAPVFTLARMPDLA